MSNYLVTGSAGFIASKVVECLLDEGHTVVGVDNLNDAYDVRLKQWRLAQIQDRPGFSFHKLDICDVPALDELFAAGAGGSQSGSFDAVINLAARAGVRQSVEDPWVYVETNVTGTLNLLEMCRRYEVPKFVLSSTSSLYGKDSPIPYGEELNTDHPLSPYAASKKAAEALCHSYHHLYGIDMTIFRYFTVYGPAGRPDMSAFRFVRWITEGDPVTIYGDGRQLRDFTYVDDIARGTVLGRKNLGYSVINLGCGQPVQLYDTITAIEEFTGKKAQIRWMPRHLADVDRTWANIEKAKNLLGWEPRHDVRSGLKRLVAWYQENREWARTLVGN